MAYRQLRHIDTCDQWVLDDKGRVVGVMVQGQQVALREFLNAEFNPVCTVIKY